MSQIYRSALRVLVWLRDSGQEENELKTFTHLPRQFRPVRDEVAKIRVQPKSSELHSNHEESPLLVTTIDIVFAMFAQPWFSRRWIIQEVVSNPDVVLHCGETEIA
ncbi:hypothetical protein F5Y19DRAFT_437018 [Xylariaceae sp. FL1651]|nr:hypothetical protein F5Y19DRAFT_437018 [Xylariaceae sp. FL1651]